MVSKSSLDFRQLQHVSYPPCNYITQPLKTGHPKGISSPNHWFSGAVLVSGRVIDANFNWFTFPAAHVRFFDSHKNCRLLFWAGCSFFSIVPFTTCTKWWSIRSCVRCQIYRATYWLKARKMPCTFANNHWLAIQNKCCFQQPQIFVLNFQMSPLLFLLEGVLFPRSVAWRFFVERPCLAIPWKKLRSWDWCPCPVNTTMRGFWFVSFFLRGNGGSQH